MLSHINNGRESLYFRHKSYNQLERKTGNAEEILSELFGQRSLGIHIIAQLHDKTNIKLQHQCIAGVKLAYQVLMIV